MSIKRKLLLSNIAMVIVPIILFFIIEIILAIVMFYFLNRERTIENIELFVTIRFFLMIFVFALTNGILTYLVGKSIVKPIQQLKVATESIRDGNLEKPIVIQGKDEIADLASSFETMRRQLKEANEQQKRYEENRKELIASISHDLKTPLTSIKGYIQGMKDGVANTPEKFDRYMNTILLKVDELHQLIDDLFLFSKLDSHQESFHFEAVDLQPYLTDIIEETKYSLNDQSVCLSLSTDSNEHYFVRADRFQLKRVIQNIIQNSLKYNTNKEKEINIYLSKKDGMITTAIKDNGIGINKDTLSQIFDSFYRADSSRNSKTGGSGLGLAIAKRIIEKHGGIIWAESEVNQGTTIYFQLEELLDGENINY